MRSVIRYLFALVLLAGCNNTNDKKSTVSNKGDSLAKEQIVVYYMTYWEPPEMQDACESHLDASVTIAKNSTEFHEMTNLFSFFEEDTFHDIDVVVHIDNYNEKGDLFNSFCMDESGHFYFPVENKYKKNTKLYEYLIDKTRIWGTSHS